MCDSCAESMDLLALALLGFAKGVGAESTVHTHHTSATRHIYLHWGCSLCGVSIHAPRQPKNKTQVSINIVPLSTLTLRCAL